jgi:CRP-like cAMP-binding protein
MRKHTEANQFLRIVPKSVLEKLAPALEIFDVHAGETLYEPGDDVTHAFFPLGPTVIALVLPMNDGQAVEAATIGREGMACGVISLGARPAFARAVVRISGQAARLRIQRLEQAKRAEPRLHNLVTRYADCLIAQVLQSVACASLHALEARTARWLLVTHDRLQTPELPLTQEMLSEMFGVSRTYVTRVAQNLHKLHAISYRRGIIRVESRDALKNASCECYNLVRRHFDRVLPGVYPEPDKE